MLKLYNVGAPWERIALDVASPFPESDSENKYFMVVMDYFSKWPEVFAIPNQEASTIADKLIHEVFCRFGVPLEIHTVTREGISSPRYFKRLAKSWVSTKPEPHLITRNPMECWNGLTNIGEISDESRGE